MKTLSQSDAKVPCQNANCGDNGKLCSTCEDRKTFYARATEPNPIDAQEAAQGVAELASVFSEGPNHQGDFVMVPRESIQGLQQCCTDKDFERLDPTAAGYLRAILNALHAVAPQPDNNSPQATGESQAQTATMNQHGNPKDASVRGANLQPDTVDARELAQKIKTSCLIDGYFLVGDATDLITSFSARIRAETIEQCAKWLDDRAHTSSEYGATMDAGNLLSYARGLRALVSRA